MVVCGSAGLLVEVITKTDIVSQISRCQGASCITAASLVMARDVVLCQTSDLLHDVWARMKARGLKTFLSQAMISDHWAYSMRETCSRFS